MTCTDGSGGVLVALSGGVDSSVCALLLKEQGLRVEGLVLEFSPAHRKAVEEARRSAEALGIPLHVARCHELFSREVIDDFNRCYRRGRTPNPCIVCNPSVKFRLLEEKAQQLGLQWIATGHYAGVAKRGERWVLKKAGCLPRDQSYMLYRLAQSTLSRLLLPLASRPKAEIRELAARAGLPCADAPDSQEICFVESGDYAGYLEERFGPSEPGDFLSPEGIVCGRHQGVLRYTVGQRKGLGVALGRPVFIRRIDPERNQIELGEADDAFFRRVRLSGCVYLPFESPPGAMELEGKIRSQARPAPATVVPLAEGQAQVEFHEPQRAPAPGQSCVFYDGDTVVGGGFIESAE